MTRFKYRYSALFLNKIDAQRHLLAKIGIAFDVRKNIY